MNNNEKNLKKDGKRLERLVRLIQEALKTSPSTIIHSNHKIKNAAGRNREFDIVIMTPVNDFNIIIAIECKEYSKPVSVDKIEAFITKCNRFPDINKKVFISQSGYQVDARNAAKEYGIELYDIADINKEVVLSWLPVKTLGAEINLKDYRLVIDVTEEELSAMQFTRGDLVYFFDKSRQPLNVTKLVMDAIMAKKREIWNINFLRFMKRKVGEPVKQVTNIPFKIDFQGVYLLTPTKEEVVLLGIDGSVDTWFNVYTPDIVQSKSYGPANGPAKANYVSIGMGKNVSADFVFTQGKFKMFRTDAAGCSQELRTLATYDQKKDKLIVHN